MVILVRYGEIHLKGLNRPKFEKQLMQNIKNTLTEYSGIKVKRIDGRMLVSGFTENEAENIAHELSQVFGIHSVSIAHEFEKDWDVICENALRLFNQTRKGNETFKVVAKRSDKSFQFNSMEIAIELGGYIWEHTKAEVNLKNPDITVAVEIRNCAYVYTGIIPAAGGLPVGCGGKAALMMSGGIDSPVAGFLTMKRGVSIECIHFFSFPYTGELAKEKVLTLCKKLCRYGGSIKVHIVPFTQIQTELMEKCPDDELTILMRRFMMRIADDIAKQNKCKALVTGESIGQVASQTLDSLGCTDIVTELPVIRPLICFDKQEIIEVAKKIDTFETSILPYEDCCTVFTPKHPTTAPKVYRMELSEKLIDGEKLMEQALENVETIIVSGDKFLNRKK